MDKNINKLKEQGGKRSQKLQVPDLKAIFGEMLGMSLPTLDFSRLQSPHLCTEILVCLISSVPPLISYITSSKVKEYKYFSKYGFL